jgi:hypothetical protein
MEKTIHRTESKANGVNPLVLYLGLTLFFSTIFWVLIASAGQLTPPLMLGLMWSPGIGLTIFLSGFVTLTRSNARTAQIMRRVFGRNSTSGTNPLWREANVVKWSQ